LVSGGLNQTNKSTDIGGPAVAIVVTYNRKRLVVEVILALLNQTRKCDILVVDNASTDGTGDHLRDMGLIDSSRVSYLRLTDNLGGAGGFSEGLKYAMGGHWQWFWLMDDDAIPQPDAMKNLLDSADSPESVYGSAAVNMVHGRQKLCWPAIVTRNGRRCFVEFPDMLTEVEEVDMIPFLGFLIHRRLIERIGYPDPGFFICADDKEYCERIKAQNARLLLVKASLINHPLAQVVIHNFGLFQAAYRSMPPWKIYYDVRNKILIADKYFRHRVWTQTLPGIFWRALLTVPREKKRLSILLMTAKAIVDGLLRRRGKLVLPPNS
jgi:GT2 family glycosyltransferase